ncbi:MAG TPA: glycosyltransferase [Chloroflexi bacterium]|nr:glycosyltransferase [Chloroflexota bacterium]
MKLGLIAPSFVPSNTAHSIQVMKTCNSLVMAGADIALWVPLQTGQSATPDWAMLREFYGIESKFQIFWLPENLAFKRYDFTWKALRSAKTWGAQVIYTWMAQAAFFALFQGMFPALELHMLPSGLLGSRFLSTLANSNKKKLAISVTQALIDNLSDQFDIHFRENEYIIAPNGTEPDRFAGMEIPSEARRKLGLPQKVTAAYTGHLYEGRGLDLMLALARAFPGVHFLWIGGREDDVKVWQQKVRRANIANITLTGFVPNQILPLYQAAADILLMPYQFSVGVSGKGDTASICSPMKMFDYLSAGRVILSSDLPVFHEVLNDQNAVFCPPEDEDAWIQAFGSLITDEERRMRLSAQARKDAEMYSWRNRAQRVLDKLSQLQ